MPALRTCEGCGTKMPAFRRRNRVDGKLLCDGCTPGKPGGPGRPIGYHGSKDTTFQPRRASKVKNKCSGCNLPYTLDRSEMTVTYRIPSNRTQGRNHVPAHDEVVDVVDPGNGLLTFDCPSCGYAESEYDEGQDPFYQSGDYARNASLDLPESCQRCGTQMGVDGLVRTAGKWTCGGGCPVPQTKTAVHETGDVPRFCPFDGSQQTVSSSDGAISCSWCGKRYELRLAPSTPAMPQAVDGQPMPGQQYQDVVGPEADADGFAPAADVVPAPEPGQTDEQGFAPAGTGVQPAPVMALRTASGDLLDEDAYVRHLAITTAPDKWAAAEQVRQSR